VNSNAGVTRLTNPLQRDAAPVAVLPDSERVRLGALPLSEGVGRRTTLSNEGTHGSSDGRGRASALGAGPQHEQS